MIRPGSPSMGTSMAKIWLPAGLVMAAAFAALGYYFWRVTGSPFTTPYQINMRTYGLVYFPWQKIKPVEFHHELMRMLYRGDAVVGVYNAARQHPFRLQFFKKLVVWLFYFGPILTMPWLAWLFTRPREKFWKSFSPELRFILLATVAAYVSIMLTIYVGQPHYAAPLTILFYALVLLAMRDLNQWRWQDQRVKQNRQKRSIVGLADVDSQHDRDISRYSRQQNEAQLRAQRFADFLAWPGEEPGKPR